MNKAQFKFTIEYILNRHELAGLRDKIINDTDRMFEFIDSDYFVQRCIWQISKQEPVYAEGSEYDEYECAIDIILMTHDELAFLNTSYLRFKNDILTAFMEVMLHAIGIEKLNTMILKTGMEPDACYCYCNSNGEIFFRYKFVSEDFNPKIKFKQLKSLSNKL